MKIQLRPEYQPQNIDAIRASIRQGYRKVLYCCPCGGGKTTVAASIIDSTLKNGKSAFFIVHRERLMRQASDTFDRYEIPHGVIAPGFRETDDLIQVGMVQSLAARIKKGKKYTPDIIFIDEAHGSVSPTWLRVIAAITNPKAIHILLTATPERLDRKPMSDVADVIVFAPSVRELINMGYLSDYVIIKPNIHVNSGGLEIGSNGDFTPKSIRNILDNPAIVGDTIKQYRQYADGEQALAFCADIAHAKNVADAFNEAGIPAAHVDGKRRKESNAAFDAFRKKELMVVTNCGLVNEGFDLPQLAVMINLCNTASYGRWIQKGQRPMRAENNNPDKLAKIIDQVGDVHRHLDFDQPHEWSLEGEIKRKMGERDYVPPVRQCPVAGCWTVHTPRPTCPACGFLYEVTSRELEQIAGELVMAAEDAAKLEAARAKEELRREQKRQEWDCRSLEDFERLAVQRGYRSGWAGHRWSVSKHNPERSVMA